MKKHNPLFLDSTQPVGDKVITNVELFGIQLEQGQSLYLEVTDSLGLMQKFVLKQLATKKSIRYCAELWLNQGDSIQYRFILIANGSEFKSSGLKTAVAGVSISDTWLALESQQITVKKKKASSVKKSQGIKNISFSKGQESLNASDIQQLKFLLEGLE